MELDQEILVGTPGRVWTCSIAEFSGAGLRVLAFDELTKPSIWAKNVKIVWAHLADPE